MMRDLLSALKSEWMAEQAKVEAEPRAFRHIREVTRASHGPV